MFSANLLRLKRHAFLFFFGQRFPGNDDKSPVSAGRTYNRHPVIGRVGGADGLFKFDTDLLRRSGVLRRGHMCDVYNRKKDGQKDGQRGESGYDSEQYA